METRDWLSFIDLCQVTIGKSQIERAESSQTVLPPLLEAAGRLHTRAGRLLGRIVILRIASRLNGIVGPAASTAYRLSPTAYRLSPSACRLADSRTGGALSASALTTSPIASEESGVAGSRIDAVLNYIRMSHLQPDCSLVHVSQLLGVSRFHLSRLVLKQTGVTFKGHLQAAKMNTAAKLLQQTSLSIKEIASATGYAHTPSFDRQFRHHFRMTPGGFRLRGQARSTA